MNPTQVSDLLTDVLAAHGLELEAVEIAPSGKRSRVRVVVDGDGPDGRGPGLDDIGAATRAVSAALDESAVTGDAPYTLEVTSRGVTRPLALPQHWRRNRGRLVLIDLTDGTSVTGRITVSSETDATLDVAGAERVVELADVAKAVVQVEFAAKNRGSGPATDIAAADPDIHPAGSERDPALDSED